MVGPCGIWLMVIAVGVPLCSWRRIMSDRAADFADESRFGRMVLPLFSRIAVGNRRRISLLNVASLVLGLRDVVTSGLGSDRPLSILYSSSSEAWASAVSASSDSSYL